MADLHTLPARQFLQAIKKSPIKNNRATHHFEMIAKLWNGYLSELKNQELTPEDVMKMMVLVKVAREEHLPSSVKDRTLIAQLNISREIDEASQIVENNTMSFELKSH